MLIAHSNAGAFVPALSARRDVVAAVFVDAVLPKWTQWWDPADVAPLFPDDATRVRVVAEQRRSR